MTRLGAFELSSFLGEGGMGQVWLGKHAETGTDVAVKILLPQVLDNEEYRTAFETEVRSVAALDHPNIVTVLDYGQIDEEAAAASIEEMPLVAGSPYLVMEYARGGAVGDYFRKIRWPDMRELLLVVLDALAHAHAREVIHRDLKPENILVGCGPNWDVKLTDFGLAHAADRFDDTGKVETPWGTPQYMAPEQLRGLWREYGPWTDIYGLGCMAYELICGKWPFDGKTVWEIGQAHLKKPVPPMEARFRVPDGVEEWLLKMLGKRRSERFAHAADAAYALRQLPSWDDREGFGVLFEPPQDPREIPEAEEDAGVSTQILPELRSSEGHAMLKSVVTDRRQGSPEANGPGGTRGTTGTAETGDVPPLPWHWRRRGEGSISNELLGISLGLFGLRAVPLVGRKEERDRLWETLRQVHDEGRALQLVVEGSAGTGKSELVRWICRRAREVGGARVLTAYHSPSPGAGDGLVPMVARFLKCSRLDPEKLEIHLGKTLINEGIADQFDLRALLALLAGEGSGEQQLGREERYAIIYRMLALLSNRRPVIVWLDDVQWGLDAIGFAEYVHERQQNYPAPIAVLMTTRTEGLAERPTEERALARLLAAQEVQKVDLEPLDEADIDRLLCHLLRLDPELAEHVRRRSQGVPLFAVQLVEDWVARRKLEMSDGGFRLRQGASISIPDDLHALWDSRVSGFLERRAPETLQYLEIAAALGQEVDEREWRVACEKAGLPGITGLVERMVEDDLADSVEEGFHFSHGMLQESLERKAREEGRWPAINRACAEALQELVGDRDSGVAAERVAWHWTEAGETGLAIAPLSRAIDGAIARSDFEHALDLIGWREELTGADGEWRVANELARVRVLAKIGEYRRCAEDALNVAKAATELGLKGSEAQAHVWAAVGLRALGDLERAEAFLRAAGAAFAREGLRGRRAQVLLELGRGEEQRGDYVKAHDHFEAGRLIYHELGDAYGEAQCYNAIGDVLRGSGDFDGAHQASVAALELYRELGTISGVADCLNDLAEWSRMQGDLEEAREFAEEALRLYQAVGSAEERFVALNLAMIRVEQGEAEAVIGALKDLIESFEDSGQTALAGQAAAGWLAARASLGRWDQWEEILKAAQVRFEATGVRAPLTTRALHFAADAAERAGRADLAVGARRLARSQASGIRQTASSKHAEPVEE